VDSAAPVIPATERMPPRPSARAAAPSTSRRCRSFRCGLSAANTSARTASIASVTPASYDPNTSTGTRSYFSAAPRAPGRVAIRPSLSDDPTSWPGATRPRWSRPGASFQRPACSGIWCRPLLCRGPATRPAGN
jgi:hypothetical protein